MDVIDQLTTPVLSNAILHTAAYADVFDYPLTTTEIHRYLMGIHAPREAVEQSLRDVRILNSIEGFYTLPGREALTRVRRQREQAATRLWPTAIRYGHFIANLPFVRMLAVTGSLAMNNVNDNSDIDYLIVTSARRLWMCRAMVLAIVRLASLQGVRLCPNYLISERSLVFPDRTLYAAHELAQMIPLFGMQVYRTIYHLNRWREYYLPNADGVPPMPKGIRGLESSPGIRSVMESALLTPPGDWFEHWEMERKIRKLSYEQGDSPESSFSADYCKGHLHRHSQRTEQILRKRLESLSLEYTT
jgi:hypothetical protein